MTLNSSFCYFPSARIQCIPLHLGVLDYSLTFLPVLGFLLLFLCMPAHVCFVVVVKFKLLEGLRISIWKLYFTLCLPFFVHSNLLLNMWPPLPKLLLLNNTHNLLNPSDVAFVHKCLELTVWDSIAHQGLLSLEMTACLPRSSHWLPGALCVDVETWNFPLIIDMWAGILSSCRSFLATYHCRRVLLIFWYNE